MNSIFFLSESLTNGYKNEILTIISLFVILSGIMVIIINNPIISILFLIGLFAGISMYLILLNLTFIGLSYLIVYIGAVSILFLFILMLINIRMSELQSNTNNSIPLAILTGIIFNHYFSSLLPYNLIKFNNFSTYFSMEQKEFYLSSSSLPFGLSVKINNDNLFFVSNKTWDSNLIETDHITSIGNIMYTNYNM